MEKNLTFHGVGISEDVINHVHKKLVPLEKFIFNIPENRFLDINLTIIKERTDYVVTMHLKTHKHDILLAHNGPNILPQIDKVIDQVQRTLQKEAEKS